MKINKKKIVCDCGKKINIFQQQLGKEGRCPRCDKKILIDRTFFDDTLIQNKSEENSQAETLYDADQSSQHFTKEIKKEFAQYEIHEKLGQGGMGVVYKAFDPKIKRYVALKIIVSNSAKLASRFFKEMEFLGKLQHPNIVSLHSYGVEPQPFIIMEFIDGKTLSTNNNMPFSDIARVFQKLASALNEAHDKGIIHRDIKPSNIMMVKKEPKLMDFGLAKLQTDEEQLSRTGEVLGTLSYMSPEQAQGEKITHHTDIYSLGATLYHILTGRAPFDGDTNVNIIFRLCYTDPVAPRSLNPDIPVDLEAICLKCLEKNTKKRYQSAAELSKDLNNFIHGHPVNARPYNLWNRAGKLILRHKLVSSLILIGVVLVLATNFVYIHFLQTAQQVIHKKHRSSQITLANIALNEARDIFEMKLWQYSALYSAKCLEYLKSIDGENIDEIKTEATHYFVNSLNNTGICWATPKSHKFSRVAYSQDGKYLAVVHQNKIRIQDILSKDTTSITDTNTSQIFFFDFMVKSKFFVIGFYDGRVLVYHLNSRKDKLAFVVRSSFVINTSIAPQIELGKDGKTIYYISIDGYIVKYNVNKDTHTDLLQWTPPSFAVAEKNENIAIYHEKIITIFNEKQQKIQEIQVPFITEVFGDGRDLQLTFLQQGSFLVAHNESECMLWQKNGELYSLYFHEDYTKYITNEISSRVDRETTLVANSDETIIAYSAGRETTLVANSDETIIAYSADKQTFLWDIASQSLLLQLPDVERNIIKLQFIKEDQELILFDGNLHVWLVDEQRILWEQKGNINIDKVVSDNKGKNFVVLDKNGYIELWDLLNGKKIHDLQLTEFIQDVYFQSDILVIITDEQIYNWDYIANSLNSLSKEKLSAISLDSNLYVEHTAIDEKQEIVYYIVKDVLQENEDTCMIYSFSISSNSFEKLIELTIKGYIQDFNVHNNLLLAHNEKEVVLVDLANKTTKNFSIAGHIRQLEFFHNGKYLLGLLDGSISIFDLDGNIVKNHDSQVFDVIENIYIAPQYSEYIFLLAPNICQLLNLSNVKDLYVTKTLLGYNFENITIDSKTKFLINAAPEQVTVWDLSFELETDYFNVDLEHNTVQKIEFINEDMVGVLIDQFEVWNIKEKTKVWQTNLNEKIVEVSCRQETISLRTDKSYLLYNREGQQLYQRPLQYGTTKSVTSDDGRFLSGYNIVEKNIEIYDLRSDTLVHKIPMDDTTIHKLYFTPQGELLITKFNGYAIALKSATWETIWEHNFYYMTDIQFGLGDEMYVWGNQNFSIWKNFELLFETQNEIFNDNNEITFIDNHIFAYQYPTLHIYQRINDEIIITNIIPLHETKHIALEKSSYKAAIQFYQQVEIYDLYKALKSSKFQIHPLFKSKFTTMDINELLLQSPEYFANTIFSMRIDDSFKVIENDLFVK